MPITFHPASHKASRAETSRLVSAKTPEDLLRECSFTEHGKCEHIIQSSFSDLDSSYLTVEASNNGFVDAAISAYNNHRNLIIRPDDVWLAILTQFNLYVNAHPEELRHHFVAHEGQKALAIATGGNTTTYDWGEFPLEISKLIHENVIDPELRTWIIPDFTTTTATDKVVCSIVMMSTLQRYFIYLSYLLCGIPSVTLEGEKADWQEIMKRINKLPTFGEEAKAWHKLLVPVISRFITAFDDPETEENQDFWQKIAHTTGGGSGPTFLSGWITAFCFWREDGVDVTKHGKGLSLDGVQYHNLTMDNIAPGWAAVPVTVNDNGFEYKASMMSGSVGIRNSSSGHPTQDGSIGMDTLQPEVGWWMMKLKPERKTVEGP